MNYKIITGYVEKRSGKETEASLNYGLELFTSLMKKRW